MESIGQAKFVIPVRQVPVKPQHPAAAQLLAQPQMIAVICRFELIAHGRKLTPTIKITGNEIPFDRRGPEFQLTVELVVLADLAANMSRKYRVVISVRTARPSIIAVHIDIGTGTDIVEIRLGFQMDIHVFTDVQRRQDAQLVLLDDPLMGQAAC